MCAVVHSLPVGHLMLFGLAKYHLLFAIMSAAALWAFDGTAAGDRVRRAVLLLHAANFLADDTWAAQHLSWAGDNAAILLPQAVIVLWDLRCGLTQTVATPPGGAAAAADTAKSNSGKGSSSKGKSA